MAYNRAEHDHIEVQEDARLEYHADSHHWTGVWKDGQAMDQETAEDIAAVEDLCWPNGEPK